MLNIRFKMDLKYVRILEAIKANIAEKENLPVGRVSIKLVLEKSLIAFYKERIASGSMEVGDEI